VLAVLLLYELGLRVFPALWPRGSFGVARYDPALGLNVHGGAAVYNKVRWVRRTPNRDGFLDASHERTKPPGTLRVGCFGDSYVEALQVPLEEAFYRRVPSRIGDADVETLAFGISGWGTLHSLMAYRELGPRYDLDQVIYLFVKNDPGDHYHALQSAHRARVTVKPSAELTTEAPGFAVIPARRSEEGVLWRSLKREINRYSMLARVVRAQLRLSVASREDGKDETRATVEGPWRRVPGQNDRPSEWPPEMLDEARELTRRVLARFRDEVLADGRRFAVLYVPRGNEELEGRLDPEDLWLPWLGRTCEDLGIPLIDPSAALRQAHGASVPMYDDHWSPAGHAVIAHEIEAFLRDSTLESRKSVARGLLPSTLGQDDVRSTRERTDGFRPPAADPR
jgi:hypothetical protein